MRLVSLEIVGLRSIESQTLDDCGDFNVLIGKNNSGKSNLLAAIANFFTFVSGQALATKSPSLSSKEDFYAQSSESPISLIGSFSVDESVLRDTYSRIASESPQVKQAIPAVGEFDVIHVEIEYLAKPRIGYIKSIRHQPCDKMTKKPSGPSRTLLELPLETASDLASRTEKSRQLFGDANQLESRQLDSDDWGMLKRGVTSYAYSGVTPETIKLVAEIVARSDDYVEASREIHALVGQLRNQRAELEARKLQGTLKVFAGEIDFVPDHIEYLLEKFGELRILHLADRRDPIGPVEAGRLLQLKMSRGGGETLRSIQQTVISLLGVEIDAFASDTPRRIARPAYRRSNLPDAELDVDEFLVQVNGSGIREALRLVLDLEFQRPDLLLVEEPEIHLHPALEVAMMRHLKTVSLTTQVFLTTHSTNFLDTGDMRNIYMVQKETSTQVRHLNIDDVEAEIPKELGIRLSSLFMFDRLVFVEGVSDELVLRAFAQTLGYNLGRANVGFVVMGGARNFTHYAAHATLTLLTKRQVKSVFVLDRDEKQETQIEKLVGQLGGQGDLHVLENREIENYLLDPESLSEFILTKAARGGRRDIGVTADDIALKLRVVADSLRDMSIIKRVAAQLCQVHRVDRQKLMADADRTSLIEAANSAVLDLEQEVASLKKVIPDLVSASEADVSENWDSRKMTVAPGHEIIDNVMKEFNLRFNKDRDSGDLASLIPRERVSVELSSLLKRIVE